MYRSQLGALSLLMARTSHVVNSALPRPASAEAMLLVGARFDKNPGATFDEAFRRAPVPSEDARRAYRSAWEAYRGYWLRPGCAVGAKGTCVS